MCTRRRKENTARSPEHGRPSRTATEISASTVELHGSAFLWGTYKLFTSGFLSHVVLKWTTTLVGDKQMKDDAKAAVSTSLVTAWGPDKQ